MLSVFVILSINIVGSRFLALLSMMQINGQYDESDQDVIANSLPIAGTVS